MAKSITKIAEVIVRRLKAAGFKVQRYDAYSTQSVYLKLDYGVCNSIRISDHLGKPYLQYRFNIIKGLNKQNFRPKSSKYPRNYYAFTELEKMIDEIISARDEKLTQYGEARYKYFMDKNLNDNSQKRGFWAQCVEV